MFAYKEEDKSMKKKERIYQFIIVLLGGLKHLPEKYVVNKNYGMNGEKANI